MNNEIYNNKDDFQKHNNNINQENIITNKSKIPNNYFIYGVKKISPSNNNNKNNMNNIYHKINFQGRNNKNEEKKNFEYSFNYNNNNQNLLLQMNNLRKDNEKLLIKHTSKNSNSILNSQKEVKFYQNYHNNISSKGNTLLSNNKLFFDEINHKTKNTASGKNNQINIQQNPIYFNDNNIPTFPENDKCIENFENLIIKKKNFNMIPIPKNLKPLNTEYKKNIFNENKSRNLNKCPSIKRVFKNIDINIDYFNEQTISPKIKNTSIRNAIFNAGIINKNINNNDNGLNNFNCTLKYNYSQRNLQIKSTQMNKINKSFSNENKNNMWQHVKIKKKLSRPLNIQVKKLHNFSNDDFQILWSGKSQAGKDRNGYIKTNQDAFQVYENLQNIKKFNIYILCDGHGKNGYYVSKFLTHHIIKKLISHPSIINLKSTEEIYSIIIQNNYQIIKEVFSETDTFLSLQKNFDTITSGSTCVLVIQLGPRIICANVGDSRAILVYSNNTNLFNAKIFPLSVDSKPDLPQEIKRIVNCGGEVHKKLNNKGKYVGPMRVYAKGKDFPGLAMSRSFGDFQCKKYGVINEPSFVEYCLDENCKYIVMCSDGVWDFLDNENVVKIGNKHYLRKNPEGFCREILGNATYWWEKEDIIIDDITALIIFFNFFE